MLIFFKCTLGLKGIEGLKITTGPSGDLCKLILVTDSLAVLQQLIREGINNLWFI